MRINKSGFGVLAEQPVLLIDEAVRIEDEAEAADEMFSLLDMDRESLVVAFPVVNIGSGTLVSVCVCSS